MCWGLQKKHKVEKNLTNAGSGIAGDDAWAASEEIVKVSQQTWAMASQGQSLHRDLGESVPGLIWVPGWFGDVWWSNRKKKKQSVS